MGFLKNLASFQGMLARVSSAEVTSSVADGNPWERQGSYFCYIGQGKE